MGFSEASVAAIAAAAGTSKQTVYSRFGTKERLFISVSDTILRGRFSVRLPSNLSLQDSLILIASQALDAMLDPKMVRMNCIIAAEAKRFPELARMADDDATFPSRALMQKIIFEATEKGELRCVDPRRAMLMLQDMVLASPLRSAAGGRDILDAAERRAWVVQAVDLFLEGARAR